MNANLEKIFKDRMGMSTFVAVTPDGFCRVNMSFEDLGPMEDVLRGASARLPIEIGPIGRIKNDLVTCRMVTNRYYLAVRLPSLAIKTFWASAQDGDAKFLTPVFHRASGAIEASHTWEVRDGVALHLFIVAHRLNETGEFHTCNAYMAARISGESGWWLPPISNLHENGEICLGPDNNAKAATLVGLVEQQSLTLNTSLWKDDGPLKASRDKTRDLFRFSMGGEQLAPQGDLTNLFTKFNNSLLEEFTL